MRFPFNLYREWNIETYEDIKRSRRFCFLLAVISAVLVTIIHLSFYLVCMPLVVKILAYLCYFFWLLSFGFSISGIFSWFCVPKYEKVKNIPDNRDGEMQAFNLYVNGRLHQWRDFIEKSMDYSFYSLAIAFPLSLYFLLIISR